MVLLVVKFEFEVGLDDAIGLVVRDRFVVSGGNVVVTVNSDVILDWSWFGIIFFLILMLSIH
jgi:hypothetical protein